MLKSWWGCLVVLMILSGCECIPFDPNRERFSCTSSADCIEGQVCLPSDAGLECVPSLVDAGADGGSEDAGSEDAGSVDAGATDAGAPIDAGPDAGTSDAGQRADSGVDAGRPDGGPSDAGLRSDGGVDAGLRDAGVSLTLGLALGGVVPHRIGDCHQVTVSVYGPGGILTPVSSATPLTLSALPVGSFTYFQDLLCQMPITTHQLNSGQMQTIFYMKPMTASGIGQSTITVASGFDSASVSTTIPSAVQQFNCTIPQGSSIQQCLLPEAVRMDHTMLLQQVKGIPGGASQMLSIACRLTNSAVVVCRRETFGTPVTVSLQTIDLGTLNVQHLSISNPMTQATLSPSVDPAKSFFLKSLSVTTATLNAPLLELTPASISLSPNWFNNVVQVVSSDISVLHGEYIGGFPSTTDTVTQAVPPAPNAQRVVLAQTATNDALTPCEALVDANLNNNTVSIYRQTGLLPCAMTRAIDRLSYQLIHFENRATVRQYEVSLQAGDLSGSLTIPAIDLSRSVLLTSSQAWGGQGSGRVGSSGQQSDGLFVTTFGSSTTINVSRGSSTDRAAATIYVVEFTP